MLAKDYLEAQRSYAVDAFKASAVLAAGIIEGMLLDAIQWPEVLAHPDYPAAVSKFPARDGAINWDKVSLRFLIAAAVAVGLLATTSGRMAEGATDFRDTVHPNAELRLGARAGREESELLLALVRLMYRQLGLAGRKTAGVAE